jgi:hypothetical protein
LLWAAPAAATTTIGQLAPAGSTPATCGPSSGAYVQPTVTSGNSYIVPANGVRITSWSTVATSMSSQKMWLMVFRSLGANTYMTVSRDGPKSLAASALNTFTTNLAVNPGDILGVDTSTTGNVVGCAFFVAGETRWTSFPNPPPADGQSGVFQPADNDRLNVTAEVEVSNAFTFGATTRNKKKGKATATVHGAGPGSFALSGNGLKSQQVTLGNTVGDVVLPVIPKGKVKKKLRERGKTRVTMSVTYTPDGGAANTQTEKLKLIRHQK